MRRTDASEILGSARNVTVNIGHCQSSDSNGPFKEAVLADDAHGPLASHY